MSSIAPCMRRAPADFHSGKAGGVMIVEFTILGLPFVGRNGGEEYRLGDGMAFLIRIATLKRAADAVAPEPHVMMGQR